ncbi:restriction endonuclease subunit S [Zoogloea ramigera]|uniref:restriction endonuclease subunit S n=1 Tax=Zoogloea ramigera TaxID=350 RepID=UPI003FA231C8
MIRVADIDGVDINVESLTIRRLKDSKLPGRLIRENSLVIEKSGGGEKQLVGRAVLGRNIRFDAICSNFMAKVDCGPTLDGLYTSYLLQAAYSAKLNEPHIQQTTGIQNLRVTDYLNLKVGIPTVLEQRRIAAYLDASCAAIDAAVAAKRRQIETLDALRASTLQRVVTQGLRPDGPLVESGNPWLERIPAGWSLVQLKRIAEVHGGLTLGKSYEGEPVVEYPFLRVANVQDGHVDLTEVSTLEVPPAVAAGVTLRAGDVLMTEGGDLDKLGRGTVWEGQIAPCLHQNHVFAVRCIEHKVVPHFLAYVTASRYGRDYFEATGKRTTNLAATNATKVGAFYIPLPSLPEQNELVAYLDAEFGRLKAIQGVIGKQIDTLTAYRKSLIHECVTGQRRIGEAELAAAGVAP